jgi:hypothetical protein
MIGTTYGNINPKDEAIEPELNPRNQQVTSITSDGWLNHVAALLLRDEMGFTLPKAGAKAKPKRRISLLCLFSVSTNACQAPTPPKPPLNNHIALARSTYPVPYT